MRGSDCRALNALLVQRSQQTHHYTKQVRGMSTLCQPHSDKRRDCFHQVAFPDLASDKRLNYDRRMNERL